MGFVNSLKNLAVDNARREAWLIFKEETVRQLREECYAFGKKELKAKDIRTRLWRLDLTDKRVKRLLDVTFRGKKAGGVEHICTIMAQRRIYWQNGWIVRIDDGETDESVADLYVTPTLPASRVEGAKGFIDHARWDYPRSFAVEVECYSSRHWDRLKNNYLRNKKMGFPTVFIVPSKADAKQLKDKLLFEWKATYVENTVNFEPDHPEQATIEITKTLDNQTNNNTTPKANSQTNKTNPLITPFFEQQTISPTENLEPQEPLEVKNEIPSEKVGQIEKVIIELAEQGWHFRLKKIKTKPYLFARKIKQERYISPYNKQIQTIIENNNLTAKDYTTTTKQTPTTLNQQTNPTKT
jgi:hypothetical protein